MVNGEIEESIQAELLRRIANQEKQALAELYDRIASVMFSTSVRILGDSHEAEEVVQDVFVQIWNKASTFNPALGSPFHWAMGIARNRSIDRMRSRKRRAQMLDSLTELATIDGPGAPSPTETGLGQDELAHVRAAVDNLPPEQRRVMHLVFFGGLTHTEISKETGEPLGTVKARIRRGMLKLRDTLQAYA